MSITFHANVTTTNTTTKEAPCLCSQMAELWSDALSGLWSDAVRQNLKEEADPDCMFCKGTGVELEKESDAPFLNLANGNAVLLLRVLGVEDTGPSGDLTIPEARRAIMRARSRSNLSPYTREDEVVHGRPRVNEDGSVELRPVRLHSMGVSEERMRSYISRFSTFVEAAVDRGATIIFWD